MWFPNIVHGMIGAPAGAAGSAGALAQFLGMGGAKQVNANPWAGMAQFAGAFGAKDPTLTATSGVLGNGEGAGVAGAIPYYGSPGMSYAQVMPNDGGPMPQYRPGFGGNTSPTGYVLPGGDMQWTGQQAQSPLAALLGTQGRGIMAPWSGYSDPRFRY